MSDFENLPPPGFVPMPCPAFLYVAQKDGAKWRVTSYQVLFAKHDGESVKLYIFHPAFGGLVAADEIGRRHPAMLLIEPTKDEAEDARLLVYAKAVASELPRHSGECRRNCSRREGEGGRPEA